MTSAQKELDSLDLPHHLYRRIVHDRAGNEGGGWGTVAGTAQLTMDARPPVVLEVRAVEVKDAGDMESGTETLGTRAGVSGDDGGSSAAQDAQHTQLARIGSTVMLEVQLREGDTAPGGSCVSAWLS